MQQASTYWILIFFVITSCVNTEKVTEVIDGDTFKTKNGTTVRLLGINAPEMTEPGGDISKDVLTLMILNKNVRLERDITNKDDYGRLLRYVYQGNTFVNAEIVRNGYAEARFYPPDTMYRRYVEEVEKMAVRNGRGLWSFSVFQIPDTIYADIKPLPEKKITVETISWRDAAKYYGHTKTVEGRIVASNNTGKVCFLNFHENWRTYFTAVIFSSDFEKFPPHPEDYYLHRTVRVTGLIKEYKGKPEIIVKSPSQIEMIE
jgi:micrococcal nuclease